MSELEPCLARKMANVILKVSHVEKNGKNTFHNYAYATEADIVAPVRKYLAEQGVCVLPEILKSEWVPVKSRKGNEEFICRILMQMTFTDGKEKYIVSAGGEGQDAGDKAFYKAMTGATKYAICKTFLIPTGDDPELDDEDDGKARAQAVMGMVQAKLGKGEPDAAEKDIAVLREFEDFALMTEFAKKVKARGGANPEFVKAYEAMAKKIGGSP